MRRCVCVGMGGWGGGGGGGGGARDAQHVSLTSGRRIYLPAHSPAPFDACIYLAAYIIRR